MELKPPLLENWQLRITLLIVPYGIETGYEEKRKDGFEPFNRTLWN